MKKKILSVFVCFSLCICTVLFISGCNKKKDISVSFYVDETLYQTVKVSGGKIKEMPDDPKKTGYEFEGWFYDKDTFENEFLLDSLSDNPIKKNTSIYADFTATIYTATFKNGTEVVDTKSFTVEDTVIADIPAVPAKDYYTGSWENYTISANDITINALYTPIEYTISYTNTKEAANSNQTIYNVETGTITLKNLNKDGYTFNGWFDGENKVTEITIGSHGNKSLEAKWSLIDYTILYELDGGTNNASNLETYNVEDGIITLTNPTKEGKVFNGWELDDEFVASFSSSLAENITLVATWFDDVQLTYTIESDDNIIITGFADDSTKSTLRIFEMPETYGEYNVVGIAEEAFKDCLGLVSIIISDGVKSIGDWAFNGCKNLERITVPNSLEYIGFGAFNGCTKLKYKLEENINYIGNDTNPYFLAMKVTDKNLASYTINNATKIINYDCFSECSNLVSITIPDGVVSIGSESFFWCSKLASITIPYSVKSIDDISFTLCSELSDVYTQSSTIAEGLNDYISCGNLISYAITIYIEESITTICSYITNNYTKGSTTTIDGVTYNKYTKNE